IPHRWVYQLSKLPAAILYAASRGIYRPLSQAPFDPIGSRLFYQAYINTLSNYPFDELHSIVHDHLTPPIARYIARGEFEAWFKDSGLSDVNIGWHNENSWR